MAAPKSNSSEPSRRLPPATNPQARENQLISMAMDLAEEQLRNGTASAAVITHILKLGTEREKTEREKLKREVRLLERKDEQMQSMTINENMMKEALDALRGYQGNAPELDDGAIF